MKQIVIKIPDEIYEGTMQIKESRGISSEDVIQIPLECISDGTVLPDNPTNGDMIKALFPIFVESEKNYDAVEINYKNDWWNASYKAESKDKS